MSPAYLSFHGDDARGEADWSLVAQVWKVVEEHASRAFKECIGRASWEKLVFTKNDEDNAEVPAFPKTLDLTTIQYYCKYLQITYDSTRRQKILSRLRTRLESERRKWRETTKQKKRQDDQRDQQERKEADAEKKKGDEARRLSLKKPNKEQREARHLSEIYAEMQGKALLIVKYSLISTDTGTGRGVRGGSSKQVDDPLAPPSMLRVNRSVPIVRTASNVSKGKAASEDPGARMASLRTLSKSSTVQAGNNGPPVPVASPRSKSSPSVVVSGDSEPPSLRSGTTVSALERFAEWRAAKSPENRASAAGTGGAAQTAGAANGKNSRGMFLDYDLESFLHASDVDPAEIEEIVAVHQKRAQRRKPCPGSAGVAVGR